MFLNFLLSGEVRPFCGMDLAKVRTEENWERNVLGGLERWDRKIMGIKDSPYHAC